MAPSDVKATYFASHPVVQSRVEATHGSGEHWQSLAAMPRFKGCCDDKMIFRFDAENRASTLQHKGARRSSHAVGAGSSLLEKSLKKQSRKRQRK
jgi:hypothetical protein